MALKRLPEKWFLAGRLRGHFSGHHFTTGYRKLRRYPAMAYLRPSGRGFQAEQLARGFAEDVAPGLLAEEPQSGDFPGNVKIPLRDKASHSCSFAHNHEGIALKLVIS
jgi:hypothetical protein